MNFLFDLQLFADGATPEDTGFEEEQQNNVDGATKEDTGESTDNDWDFALDEDGNIVFNDGEGTQDTEQPAYYTQDEIKELGIDKLDPNKLPPDLVPFYKSLQADYTRKNQAVAEQRKFLEQQMLQSQYQQPQAQQPPMQQQTPEQVRMQYYEQLYNVAKQEVDSSFKQAGIEFDEFNPMHQAALADAVANIKVHMIQQQQYQSGIQNLMNNYQSDPDWPELDRYAWERLDNMPYKQASVIREKIQNGDLATIKSFLDETKAEFDARKNPQQFVKQKPPHVESGGTGNNKPATQQFNIAQIGRMRIDQQAKVLEALGLTK